MATLSSSVDMDASEETNLRSQQILESDIPKYATVLQVQNVTKKHITFIHKIPVFYLLYMYIPATTLSTN